MRSTRCWLAAARGVDVGVRPGPRLRALMTIGPVVSLIAGILILLMPRLLNYIVAIYLIIIGILGLIH